MLIIPAIDIIDGKCVRLTQGDFNQKTTYQISPLDMAKFFEASGASRLHLVDLDGAKNGKPVNLKLIQQIRKSINTPIQMGGGIRSMKIAKDYLNMGVDKLIIGSKAISDPDFVKKLIQLYGSDRITIGIDIKNNQVLTSGWQENSNLNYLDFANSMKAIGIKEVICTDISRDGMLGEPNIEPLIELKKRGLRVIASGGVSSLGSIKKLDSANVFGTIIGKAIYENKLNLSDAIQAGSQSKLAKRIIPCMDIDQGKVVKGVGFKNLKNAGDPVELAKKYSDEGADELVFLDISATIEKRKTLVNLVKKVAKAINIPFTVGGGVQSIEDVKALLNAGADKVSIGSAAVRNPNLVSQVSKVFGSQCIVISIDPKQKLDGSWEVYVKGGRESTGIDAIEFSKEMEQLGAGELLVNSLDRDGMKSGYDIDLLKNISSNVNIPVIASSGAGCIQDFIEAFREGGCDAALAASLFHYGELTISEVKQELAKNNLTIRL